MYSTRINTTINGNLHAGHLYTALVNEAVANESGGRFVVRWDDSNPAWTSVIGRERMDRIIDGQREDMEWAGLHPYSYQKQSDVIDQVHEWLSKKLTPLPDENPPYTPDIIGGNGLVLYPLTTMLTAEKVVMDWMEGTNCLIRGLDLITEYSLYQYYCRVLDLPQPRHIYLPRLKWVNGDMSKTHGAQSVSDLRKNGYTPEEVRGMLEKACLIQPPNGWILSNLKGSPCL